MLECGWVKTSDARLARLMSWGLQVAEGEEMAQGVQPEGQNVVGDSGRGCGTTCSSLMHKTNHDYRTDL